MVIVCRSDSCPGPPRYGLSALRRRAVLRGGLIPRARRLHGEYFAVAVGLRALSPRARADPAAESAVARIGDLSGAKAIVVLVSAGRTHLIVDICCRWRLGATLGRRQLVRLVPAQGRGTGDRTRNSLSGAVHEQAAAIPQGAVAILPTCARQSDALVWPSQRQVVRNKMRSPC